MGASMPSVADLIVCGLREAGVHTLFGVPGGGGNLDLIAAAGRAGLPFVLTATETGGALAAMAQAEILGRPGACLTTLGPGAASVVNGVACARLDRVPLLVFIDGHPAGEVFEHQRLDHRGLLAPLVKWSATLTPGDAGGVLEHAVRAATMPPPGPVLLECPGGVAPAPAAASTFSCDRAGDLQALLADSSRLHGLVARARKPLLLVGLGARRPDDAAAIRGLCERRGVPALVTYKAKGVVPDAHPYFAGVFTHAAIEQPVIDESDLLIGVGLDPVELLPRPWTRPQPIVYCGRWHVRDDHVPFAVQLVTDVPSGLLGIEALIEPTEWDAGRVGRLAEDQRRAVSIPADGLTPQRVVQVAAERLAHAGRVTVDAGAHMFPATMLWPVADPNGMLISNGLSTMGFALPAAIGAALLDRSQPVVALTGDGGLLMCLGELATAARERLRLIVIVFSDASLSLIEIKQQQRRQPPAGVGIGRVAWPAVAEGFGVAAFCAATEAELERGVEQALACSGPALIEARIDPSVYGATLRAVRGSS
jgi:acetolactate synthase-1/2/3 large subunit